MFWFILARILARLLIQNGINVNDEKSNNYVLFVLKYVLVFRRCFDFRMFYGHPHRLHGCTVVRFLEGCLALSLIAALNFAYRSVVDCVC